MCFSLLCLPFTSTVNVQILDILITEPFHFPTFSSSGFSWLKAIGKPNWLKIASSLDRFMNKIWFYIKRSKRVGIRAAIFSPMTWERLFLFTFQMMA
jgi:hypothetical protein